MSLFSVKTYESFLKPEMDISIFIFIFTHSYELGVLFYESQSVFYAIILR